MIRSKWIAACLAASALFCGNAFAQIDIWTGNGASGNFNDPANWSNGVPNGTNILTFSPDTALGNFKNSMVMNVAGSALGLDIESGAVSGSGDITIGGASALTLGSSGIKLNQTFNNAASFATINASLILSATQAWAMTSSVLTLGGAINGAGFGLTWDFANSSVVETAASAISGAGTSLTINNNPSSLMNVAINTGASTFTGGVTLNSGAGTVLVIGASSTGPGGAPTMGPLGTGTLTLGNFVDVTTANNSTVETIANNIAVGTGGNSAIATIQANVTGGLILTGTISDGGGFPGTIDVTGPNIGTVDFEGNNTYSGGTLVTFATVTIGTDTGLGSGPVTANNSTLNFTSNSPSLTNPNFGNSTTVNFTGMQPSLSSPSITGSSTVNFTGSSPDLFNPLIAGSSTVNFSGMQPSLSNPSITGGSTVNFTQGGGEPFLSNITMFQSVINFAADSVISLDNMTSDAPGSTNAINLNVNSVLSFAEIGNVKYYGTFTGMGSSISYSSDGSGVIDLYGANTYSGGSTIFSGAVIVADNNSALGTAAVSVNGGSLTIGAGITITNQVSFNNGTLAGYGTIAPAMADALFIQVGGTVTGGRGTLGSASGVPVPGILTFGPNANITLGGNGAMQFSIMNATAAGIGVAGTDYSTISAPGDTVTMAASPIAPFTIQLVSVNPGTGLVGLANFDPTQAYQWTLLSAGTLNGFAANAIVVDSTTDFQNPLAGGAFSVAQVGSNLVLDFTPVPEPSTWALMATGLCALGAAVRRRRR